MDLKRKIREKLAKINESNLDMDLYMIISDVLEDNYDEMHDELFPYDASDAIKEIESDARDGFIPFTDGGLTVTGFVNLGYIMGSGMFPTPYKAGKAIEDGIEYNLDIAKERFADEYPEITQKLGGQNQVDYNALQDAGYYDEAEELSIIEDELLSEDDVMFEIGVHYYDIDNSHNEFEGESESLYAYGVINWESPYFRSGTKNEWVATNSGAFRIDSENLRDVESKLRRTVSAIVNEF